MNYVLEDKIQETNLKKEYIRIMEWVQKKQYINYIQGGIKELWVREIIT